MKNILFFLALVLQSFFLLNSAKADTQSFEDQFLKSTNFMMQNMMRTDSTPGAIIAAPSKASPDYFYHWVRDAALTLDASLDLYEKGYLNAEQHQQMKNFFVNHLNFNKYIQQTSLRAEGLGEPKFSVDGQVYAFPWGRPQNDGPALRSSSLTHLLNIAINENWPQLDSLKTLIYEPKLPTSSLVKSDLEFISHHWQDLNFDLWEEVYGAHFYTLMAQRKSLADGVRTANYFLDFGAANFYSQELKKINNELEKFWNPDRNYVMATLWTVNRVKSHLDSAVILAVLHSNLEKNTFSFTDDRVIATFQKLKDSFGSLYPINKTDNYGTAFGRYAEDTYDGYTTNGTGNPWVLTTAAAAEFLYRTAAQFAEKGIIEINPINQNFFSRLGGVTESKTGKKITSNNPVFQMFLQNLVNEGDRYLERIIFHRNPDGSLSEQMNRYSGVMQGAPNLTWSHASFLTAKMARDQAVKVLQTTKGNL